MLPIRGLILHVEDEPGMVELVRETLVTEGWQVQSVSTGQSAIDLLEQSQPVLLLLDHGLPDMLGTQFLDTLAARGIRLPPFIVTTGVGDESLAVQMMKRGAADYLVKDSRFLEQLAPVVHRVVHETELSRRLAQSEIQLQFLTQYSSDILTITDERSVPRYQSPVAELITGYSLDELRRPLFDFVPNEDTEAVHRWWTTVTATPGATAKTTFRVLRKNGTPVWLEAVAQNHLDNPAVCGVIVNARDITDRKAAEQHRIDLERQMLHTQKLESLGVLAGGIAHDFNNLLAAVVGNLDLALSTSPPGSEAIQSIALAMKATERAADLTRQMLAYSGRGTFAIEAIDMTSLVQENSDIFSVSVSRNVELVTKTTPQLPKIDGDKGQVQQIVMNLLTNASEAIGSGAGTITLSTGLRHLSEDELKRSLVEPHPAAGTYVCLEVEDTGSGMPPSVIERLFDPFFTTKRTGRGLGMAAVLGIVRGHGGALFVESEVGKGTRLCVLFPARAAEDGLLDGSSTAPSEVNFRRLGATVLVVDDDASVRSMVGRLLQHLDCRPLEANGGHEALEQVARDTSIDVILMDLTMPNLGGLETTALLQKERHCPPIILCSGFGEEALANTSSLRGVNAFLKKPFRLAELRQVLEQVLERKLR